MTRFFALFVGLAAIMVQPAFAQFGPGASWNDAGSNSRRSVNQNEARKAVDSGRALPSHVIRDRLAKRYGGDLDDADMYVENGRYIYNVRWITRKGERLRLTVDARTARVLSENR